MTRKKITKVNFVVLTSTPTPHAKVIEGTKDSTADDFVSWGEFRMLNVFLCLYGAMYDAFARVRSSTVSPARPWIKRHRFGA